MFRSLQRPELKRLAGWKDHTGCAALVAVAFSISCAGAPESRPLPPPPAPVNPAPPPAPAPTSPAVSADVVSGARALERAQAWLTHADGSAAASRAEWSRLAAEIAPSSDAAHSSAPFWVRFPGRSRDRLVLAVRTPTDFDSAVDASLALEIARAHVGRLGADAPFSLELHMLGGEPAAPRAALGGEPAAPRAALGGEERAMGEPGQIRFAAVLIGSGRDQLRVARDLNSHPRFRDLFWEIAERLEFEQTFDPDASFVDTTGWQRVPGATEERTLRIVPIRDGPHEVGCCRAESATAIGRVTLAGLLAIGEDFAGIDAYARRPVPPTPWAWNDPTGSNSGGTPNVQEQETATAAEPAGSFGEGSEEAE